MSSWAKPGVKCVCKARDGWEDEDGNARPGPAFKAECVVASHLIQEEDGFYIRLLGWESPDDLFLVTAFSPIVPVADDVALFAHHLRNEAVL